MKKLSIQEISSLPTLFQVVDALKKANAEWINVGGWNKPIGFIPKDESWNSSMVDFRNNGNDDKFIIVQTTKRRHTLKPNLRNRPFIYRGQNKVYDHIISSFARDELSSIGNGVFNEKLAREKHLIANLKAEEFIFLLQQHPLFMMLDRGIVLYPEKHPLFINMNYYGLAQHYGFKTGLVDFTIDVDVAAFFACTQNNGDDVYEPITDVRKYPYGVIYVSEIIPDITFKPWGGFSTVGLQLYPRSGAQKGLVYNEGICKSRLDDKVQAILFKHDPSVSRHFFVKQDKGKKLFPSDGISKYAKEILDSNEVSGIVFARNLYSNQETLEENMLALKHQNISVNWHQYYHFTDIMLHELYIDLKNGLWEQFCKQIYIPDSQKGAQMMESLLHLPQNPAYSHYFKKEEYSRITAYEQNLHERALKNRA